MAKKYLHIGLHWAGPAKTAEIQKLIDAPDAVEDWFKYGGNCWIVYTSYTQLDWSNYLKTVIGPNDSLIICEVTNLDESNGFLPTSLWDWFNKSRA